MAQIFIPPAPVRSPQNDLNGLIQGLQAGQAIQQMPQTLQNNQINQMLQQALLREKLLDLQDPNRAVARQINQSLALQQAIPNSGYRYDPETAKAISVLGPISQPGTVNVDEAGKITQVTSPQEALQGIMAGSTASPFTYNPSIPRAAQSQKDINESLQKGREAAATRVPIEYTNGTQRVWVKPGEAIPDGFYNAQHPPTANKLLDVAPNAAIFDPVTGKEIYRNTGGLASDTASAYSSERADRILGDIDSLRSKVSGFNTGLGSLISVIPGTDARNFRADVDSLKANIAFGELAEMRAASKTGGALGSVAVKELNLLESAQGSLDTGQSSDNFIKNLDKIKESINRWRAAKASRGASNASSASSEKMVRVLKNGKPGEIPASKLADALKTGNYTVAP